MRSFVELKEQNDELCVEFEALTSDNAALSGRRRNIQGMIFDTDDILAANSAKLDALNSELDRLTNHADGADYTVAVASGIIAGLIDSFFVGEFSFERASTWGSCKINDLVLKIAGTQGYKGNDLGDAIRSLENKFPIAADKATAAFGGGRQHHLRDFSHHPTPAGLFFSLLTQFTGRVYGTNTAGAFMSYELVGADRVLIGKDMPQKILLGAVFWLFHMVSDMAGASFSVMSGGIGTGLPGPIVSLLKELSALPIFRNTNADGNKEFSVWISKLFNGTLLGKRGADGTLMPIKFDLRTEIGVAHELGRQAVPVIVNECIVRGFYFVRRLCNEIKTCGVQSAADLKNINWTNTLPIKNRTIIRMLTISTGTMTAVDLADAAIRSAIKCGGDPAAFASGFILRINFVGIGRFAIAVVTDIKMGIEREKLVSERIIMLNQRAKLYNAKSYYRQAEMWVAMGDTMRSIDELYAMVCASKDKLLGYFADIGNDIKSICDDLGSIDKHNKGLSDDILALL